MSKISSTFILASGGSGQRFKNSKVPKQYLKVDEKENLSFLQKTVKRLENFESIDKPIIICNEEHRFIVAEQMRDIKIKPKSITKSTKKLNDFFWMNFRHHFGMNFN